MIYHAIWFALGALCGGTAVAFAVVYVAASLTPRRDTRPGKPPRTP